MNWLNLNSELTGSRTETAVTAAPQHPRKKLAGQRVSGLGQTA
jgi:hypothetical protein